VRGLNLEKETAEREAAKARENMVKKDLQVILLILLSDIIIIINIQA